MSNENSEIYSNKKRSWPEYTAWYLMWLALVLCLYWPGILVFPISDAPVFMLSRHLADNDFSWFMSNLSYNRSRLIMPGDYIGFRPLLFVIITLEDILIRHNFLAQGIVCCTLYSFAATAFFVLIKKLSGVLVAFTLTLLWISQLAGSEMILWQHITSYILAPALLCAAMLVVIDEQAGSAKYYAGGAAVLFSCFSHEMSVPVVFSLAVIICLAKYSEPPHRRRILMMLAIPATMAILLNVLDFYYIHPTPHVSESNPFSSYSLVQLLGGIGNAMLLPGKVKLEMRHGWQHSWVFWESTVITISCAMPVILLLLFSAGSLLRQTIKRALSPASMVSAFFLLFFVSAYSVCMFRILARGIKYMETATYYFSLTSFALCGLIALILTQRRRKIVVGTCAVLMMLAFWHGYELRKELDKWAPAKQRTAEAIAVARYQLKHNPGICFSGIDGASMPYSWRMWGPLFQDVACSSRASAAPVYLADQEAPKLSTIRFDSRPSEFDNLLPGVFTGSYFMREIPFGHPVELTLKGAGHFTLILKFDTGHSLGMEFEYNMSSLIVNGQRDQYGTLSWNPLRGESLYRIGYTESSILLFGNGQLLHVWPRQEISSNSRLTLVLMSRLNSKPLKLISFRLAKNAEQGTLQISPFTR